MHTNKAFFQRLAIKEWNSLQNDIIESSSVARTFYVCLASNDDIQPSIVISNQLPCGLYN